MMSETVPMQPTPEESKLPAGVLILGTAKSGTTALFYAIRNALSAHGIAVGGRFEPRRPAEVEEYWQSTTDRVRLVKMLLGHLFRHSDVFVNRFDKKIVIFRDPRDNVVSRIHFMLKNLVGPKDKARIAEVIQLFREKESAPDSISILSMLRQIEKITGHNGLLDNVRNSSILPARIKREHGNEYYMMSYDDLVSGQFDSVSEYLGFTVSSDFEVADKHSYVVRSKSSGAWKDWFLDEDIQFFVRDVADEFRILGFDPDAPPNGGRHIDRKTSSDYVAAQFERMVEKHHKAMANRRQRDESRPSGNGEEPGIAAVLGTPARQESRGQDGDKATAQSEVERSVIDGEKRQRRKKRRGGGAVAGNQADDRHRARRLRRRMRRRPAPQDAIQKEP